MKPLGYGEKIRAQTLRVLGPERPLRTVHVRKLLFLQRYLICYYHNGLSSKFARGQTLPNTKEVQRSKGFEIIENSSDASPLSRCWDEILIKNMFHVFLWEFALQEFSQFGLCFRWRLCIQMRKPAALLVFTIPYPILYPFWCISFYFLAFMPPSIAHFVYNRNDHKKISTSCICQAAS